MLLLPALGAVFAPEPELAAPIELTGAGGAGGVAWPVGVVDGVAGTALAFSAACGVAVAAPVGGATCRVADAIDAGPLFELARLAALPRVDTAPPGAPGALVLLPHAVRVA